MRIGIDLDNTIIDYSQAFAIVGAAHGVLPDTRQFTSKAEVKAFLKAENEEAWMRLQGLVYGREIHHARLYDGVRQVLEWARSFGHSAIVVSHKTQFGHFDEARTDLRKAALEFLEGAGLVGQKRPLLQDVHFEPTRDLKLARIRNMAFDVFIDDLAVVLTHPDFPSATRKILFQSGDETELPDSCESWRQIGQRLRQWAGD